jgi:hypothetical protein
MEEICQYERGLNGESNRRQVRLVSTSRKTAEDHDDDEKDADRSRRAFSPRVK